MKNAKEIKIERSLDSYKSMNQIKKNTDFLYELLNSLNAYKILNDSDFFILLSNLNNYSAKISEFESIFFDSKSTTIAKNHKNLEVIAKNNEDNMILTKKFKNFLNTSDKNIQKIKKILTAFLILAISMGMVACSGGNKKVLKVANEEELKKEEEKDKKEEEK